MFMESSQMVSLILVATLISRYVLYLVLYFVTISLSIIILS